jgi:hypothetical protein
MPNCKLTNPLDSNADNNDPSILTNTLKAAYWDAAEKYYSVCMHGRTSVGNPVGQYNPNSRDLTASASLNPDARYNDLYNIRYSHNSGVAGNTLTTDHNVQQQNSPIAPTTYNPESFAGEVRFILPPALAAAFPMCIRQGTSTPSGSASASVVQGAPVILPLRCAVAANSLHAPAFSSHLQSNICRGFQHHSLQRFCSHRSGRLARRLQCRSLDCIRSELALFGLLACLGAVQRVEHLRSLWHHICGDFADSSSIKRHQVCICLFVFFITVLFS